MKIVGIDASSQSIAWGVTDENNLLSYGEIFMRSADFDLRLLEIRKILETEYFFNIFNEADYIIFERVVLVRNKEVAMKLAQMFGVMKSVLLSTKGRLIEAPPMAWQESIGNPVLRGQQRRNVALLHPEWKTKAQIDKGIRDYRKSLTQKIVLEVYGEDISSDNICDAIGLSMFGRKVLKK